MTVFVVLADLRVQPARLEKHSVTWISGMTAYNAIEAAVGPEETKHISQDLSSNEPNITVSWYDTSTGEVPEIGGVGSLDWVVSSTYLIVVSYDDNQATEEQYAAYEAWFADNFDF